MYALIPASDRHKAAQVIKIATGLNMPNGVAFYRGNLYVADVNRILKFNDITHHLKNPKFTVVTDKLPTSTYHGYRYLGISPDGWLYVSIGVPCNVCLPKNPYQGTIARLRPNGSALQIFAKGVRNSVGFAWHPQTKELWFTDNGRDWLGDDLPPDELNVATKPDLNFGYPYCYGNNIADPYYGKLKSCHDMVPPIQNLSAHVAALGMAFAGNQIFIAEHGSWNRTHKSGYRIMKVTLKNNKPISYEPYITGWLQGEKNWGRPVDVKFLSDHSLLISDDDAGVIYRLKVKI